LADGRVIGVQATDIDPHPKPGKARAAEKRITASVYGGFAQNDQQVYLHTLKRTVLKKIALAEKHYAKWPPNWLTEV
jgi:hypothetical protein